jgi:hypothetical protein
MQANDCTWDDELAEQCHQVGLKVLLSGRHQPPVRTGAIRVCHQWSHVDGVECVECG